MKKYLQYLAAGMLFLASCTSQEQTENSIDYSTLPDIQTETILEIGESENFIPGQLQDLVIASDGSILVSDWGSTTIEQFSTDGMHIATIAVEGGGPGELSGFFSMRDTGYDSMEVRHQGGRKDYFGQDESGTFVFSRSLINDAPRSRVVDGVGLRSETEQYAIANPIISDIQSALANDTDYRNSAVVTIDKDQTILADSLYLLKTPLPHITGSPSEGIMINILPYRYHDRFLPLGDGQYILARPDSSAFFTYDQTHTMAKRIPFHTVERPLTSSDIDYALDDIPADIRNDIENRLHDQKPPYLNAWVSQKYIWLHTDTGAEGKEIVIIDFDGNTLGKFLLPDVDEIKHVEDEKIYSIHKDPETGDSVRVYSVDV